MDLQKTIGNGVLAAWLLVVMLTAGAAAQSRSAPPAPVHSATLAEGWGALGAGDLSKAGRAAARAMTEAPLDAGAVALAVEVDIASGGAPLKSLNTYERWLGGRKVDAPYVLRRVAQAYLRSISTQRQHLGRLDAAKALAADGDQGAVAELMRGAAAGGPGEAHLLAALGDPRGVEILIGQLQTDSGGKLSAINGLVQSGNKLAVPALVHVLSDPREDNRAAAADALGKLGAADAIPNLKGLLKDPVYPVRLAAAGALYRLDDHSGIDLLQPLLASEHPAARLSVAEVMAVRPGPEWLGIVRQLAADGDETVRLGAARLLAPHDLELAAATLRGLSGSENPAVREEAGRIYVARIATDFAGLRAQMRSGDGVTAVKAADRVLELTRR